MLEPLISSKYEEFNVVRPRQIGVVAFMYLHNFSAQHNNKLQVPGGDVSWENLDVDNVELNNCT